MTALPLFAAFLAGFCLGIVYFAILWASVRRHAGGAPVWALAASALLRLALVLGVIAGALALGLAPTHLALAVLGFFAARLAATRIVRPSRKEP